MKSCQMNDNKIKSAEPLNHYSCLTRVLAFVIALGTIWACSYLKPIDRSRPQNTGSNRPNLIPVYHDFDDVLVPKTMRINRKMTALNETQNMLAGVLALEGNVHRREIIQFFKTNMVKDNWIHVDQLIGPRSLFQFEKHNRWCVLTITESPGGLGTKLDIWVIPKIDAVSSGLLK